MQNFKSLNPDFEIVETADGSHTLFLPELNEHYHSVNGAFTESNHVFLNCGFNYSNSPTPKILEIGYGTGLNCILTAMAAEKQKRKTSYFTVEKYPLDIELIEKLNYIKFLPEKWKVIFHTMHTLEWGQTTWITPWFELTKLFIDVTEDRIAFSDVDIIYFDAFGPDKQPELWQPAIFEKLYQVGKEGCIFVTYSAKGLVRRQLSEAGFWMERIEGPPGKKEMLRGILTGKIQ